MNYISALNIKRKCFLLSIVYVEFAVKSFRQFRFIKTALELNIYYDLLKTLSLSERLFIHCSFCMPFII